ncbi:Ribosomal RNA-processing protein 14 like [Verticillium longisporum]|uniref:Ribosomal RNA-processing protein 14 like n=1 Tax=Verticillium longisporum TaxID=100787 RepID=A0A8I3AR67_VERLO|nr:Ribosomal RNA-processing protein 14 like [Verticillium longisporum]
MTDSSLQDRLRDHAKAFDGLLSLIPAKMYYGEDTSDQWNRKKQTKAEAKAARMGKLDPDNDRNRNAKDVMEERAKNKRKLQEMEDAEQAALPKPAPAAEEDKEPSSTQQDQENDNDDAPGVVQETPGQGLRRRDLIANKKLKIDRDFEQDNLVGVSDANPADMTQDQLMKLAKRDGQKADRKAKQARQAEKKAKKLAAKEAAAAAAASQEATEEPVEASEPAKAETKKPAKSEAKEAQEQKPRSKTATKPPSDDGYETVDSEAEPGKPTLDMAGLEEKPASTASSQRSPSHSPVFDDAAAPASGSAATSVDVPPSDKPKQLKIPQDTSALKARLAARIAELQAARKAIGPDGKPIRTRQELIEAQRARQAQRKAHKQEQRRQARLEEERQRDEALASNSPSIMSPALDHLLGDGAAEPPTDYTFGRVAFDDGTRMSRDLTHLLGNRKKKGPSDPKTALLRLQNQKKKHAALDEARRDDIAEKETWLTARRRAEGEKIRDDEATLKKTIKRKDKQKRKSEKEWKDRTEGVAHAKAEKQKKREANLKKRKDDKKLGKAGRKVVGAATKKKGRPGFEGGSFGGKKKK